MDLLTIISITLGFISILLGFVSIYIAIKISVKATSIEQKTDDKIIKDVVKKTETEDVENLDSSDIQTAVDLLQQSGKKHDASYYYLLALKEYKNGYYTDAVNNLTQAIQFKNGKFPAALFYLGHTYLKQGNTEKAKDCFEKAVALGHKNAEKSLKNVTDK